MPLFDAHNHLQDARLDAERDRVLEDCGRVGIEQMVVNGTGEADWDRVVALAERHASVIPSFGIHPWHAANRSRHWRGRLERLLDRHPAAVGEVGLDRWMRKPDLAAQEEVFRGQIRIAAERNLPITIHCLKAWGWLLEILQSEALPKVGFLLHSYSGSAELLPRFVDLGARFSLSGYFAHPSKAQKLKTFKSVPPQCLLIETDAPDMLPPCPEFRLADADSNHPANLAGTYRLADMVFSGLPGALETQVATNFRELFGSLAKAP